MVESKCETTYQKKVKRAPPPSFKVQENNILTILPHKFDPKKKKKDYQSVLMYEL